MLGTTLLVSAAASQTSTTSTGDNKTATINSQGQWRSSKLLGVEVYNGANEKLGSIEDLIISTNGNIGSVIVGVGGFLGVGEHSVSVSFDKLTWVNEAVRTTTSSNTSSATSPATSADGGLQDDNRNVHHDNDDHRANSTFGRREVVPGPCSIRSNQRSAYGNADVQMVNSSS
jgi:sporulation protein YlmC with PRC-barrel domain